jgi:hypothetical protein
VWGANKASTDSASLHSVLAEAQLSIADRHTFFFRAERIQRNAADLVVDTPALGFASDRRFNGSNVVAGYVRDLSIVAGATVGVGGAGIVTFVPRELEPVYGLRTPTGGLVFLRVRPSRAPASQAHH